MERINESDAGIKYKGNKVAPEDAPNDAKRATSGPGAPGPGKRIMSFMKGAVWGREFLTYLAFVVIFSIVAFRSKPGIIQYYLNTLNQQNFAQGVPAVGSQKDILTWLRTTYANLAFPSFNYDGTPLSNYSRLYISGEGRVLGALRLRQVRSRQRVCNVPKKLKYVAGVQVNCTTDYSKSTRLVADIIQNNLPQYKVLNYTRNFTLPFSHMTSSALNATDVSLEGDYDTYDASGYALDVVPNVDPNTFASLLDSCWEDMVLSLRQCMLDQGFSEDDISRAQIPPEPVLYGATNCTRLRSIEDQYVPGLNLTSCQKFDRRRPFCVLRFTPFALVRKYMQPEFCGNCKCVRPDDPAYADCVSSCSPKDLFVDQVDILEEFGWMDRNTRAVILDTSLYYPNNNLFTVIRNVFEMPQFGGIGQAGAVYGRVFTTTFKIFRYQTYGDLVVLGFEIVLLGFIGFYTFEELFEIKKQGFSEYFSEGWNYVDWANLAIFYSVIALRGLSYSRLRSFSFDSEVVTYIDFPAMAVFADAELNVNSINFFLMYFKFFKYLRSMPRFDAILVTVSNAAFDLILFVAMAVIILTGFAAAYYTCFGADVRDYATLGDSFGALGRALLGDFSYSALKASNPAMAPVLFYAFFAMVFFILLNMFLAIMNDSYMVTKSHQTEEDLNFYIRLKDNMKAKLGNLFHRKQAISQFARDLETRADANDDDLVDIHELEKVLEGNPQALEMLKHSDAKALLAKYDVNRDGVLTKKEMTQLLSELYQKEADLQAEITATKDGARDAARTDPAAARSRAGNRGLGRVMSNRGMIGPEGARILADVGPSIVHLQASVDSRFEQVENEMRDMNRTVAKKMSLMIDLLMSLSDQVAVQQQQLAGGPPGIPNAANGAGAGNHSMPMLQSSASALPPIPGGSLQLQPRASLGPPGSQQGHRG